ncbi:hypothetical protein C1645_735564 [Glomus cerebriforme]|uniref:Uncharacterized protein n=1 Tax=Glomus cerebriforme TaxID=658196 RepID=A0A397TAM7_9GLOM|nr:hypothetical protein C1645_735564 [Glomus cerebriforme]
MTNSFSPKSKNNVREKFKVPSEPKDSPGGIDIPNFKSIVRNVLNSKNLPFIIILAVVGVSNIERIIWDLMKLKKLSLIIMSFVGIYILRDYIIGQDHNSGKDPKRIMSYMYSLWKYQDTDKSGTHENKLQNSDEIDGKHNSFTSNDDNDSDDNEELRYDPSKNYEELAWEAFCDSNKEDPIIKKNRRYN